MPKNKKTTTQEEVGLSLFPSRGDGFTELSRLKQGRLFEKHILTKGTLIHPVTKAPINIDDEFVAKLQENFRNGVCDIVQVPLAGSQNQHTEDPERNLGEVVDIKERDGKVYAVIDARKHSEDFGKTLIGASAMLHQNYVDTRTGKAVGPTLLHVAVTNRPYVVGLEDYKEVLSASNMAEDTVVVYETPEEEKTQDEVADNSLDETQLSAVSEEAIQETTMTLDEILATLKAEHGIDVPALQAAAQTAETQTALSNDLASSLAALLKDSDSVELSASDEVTNDVIVGAIAELANTNKVYLARVEKLETHAAELQRDAAKTEVEALVTQGRVLPTQVESLVELKLSNPSMFDSLVPAEPIVKMNIAIGSDPKPVDKKNELNIDEEILRYSNLASQAK